MLFHVRMDVCIPRDAGSQQIDKLRLDEKARAQQHVAPVMADRRRIRPRQHFDVESPDKLHEILTSLPLL